MNVAKMQHQMDRNLDAASRFERWARVPIVDIPAEHQAAVNAARDRRVRTDAIWEPWRRFTAAMATRLAP